MFLPEVGVVEVGGTRAQEGSSLVLYSPLLLCTVGGIAVAFTFRALLLLERGQLWGLMHIPRGRDTQQ